MPKFSALIYGEGRQDKNFLKSIVDLRKFCWHTNNWIFQFANASGESPRKVLEKCRKKSLEADFDLIICFIDLDVLKDEFPRKWKERVEGLEKDFPDVSIFWHEDNLEDELCKVLGKLNAGKTTINQLAKKNSEKFINSKYWNKLLAIVKQKEAELIKSSNKQS